MKKIPNRLSTIPFAILTSFTSMLHAEVILDGSLGTMGALSGPDFLIEENLGQQYGTNLFHSFESFNLNPGESATFTAGADSVINHVIGRVTGDNASRIDGTLRSTIPKADVYLLNPNGIMFGKHALLDVQGSFYASTANNLRLGTDGLFDASTPSNSLLTVAPPSSFGFFNNTPAGIGVEGSLLYVPERKTLSLVGGDLNITGGILYAPDGKINLISMASPGEVVPGLLNNAEKLGNITLSSSPNNNTEVAMIDTSGTGGGEIFIQSGQLISTGGYIASEVINNANSGKDNSNQASKVSLLVQDKIELSGSNISVDTHKGTNHDGGDIVIETHTMTLTESCDYCGISSDTSGKGDSGAINITAQDITIKGIGISVVSGKGKTGKAGNIRLETGQLRLQNGGYLNSGTLGSGQGGDIAITASQGVSLVGGSQIASTVGDIGTGGSGKGGNIHIVAPRLEIKNVSVVQTGAIDSTSGHAGNIRLDVDHLILENEGTIITSTMGSGRSGDINIFSNHVKMTGGEITSRSTDSGDAGSITLTTDTASLTQRSSISTEALAGGGGNILVTVHDNLYLADSLISAEAIGHKAEDKGGNLTIKAPTAIFTVDKSKLVANANVGHGGNIDILAKYFIHSSDSEIDVSSRLGIDGDVYINARQFDFKDYQSPSISPLLTLSLNRCAGFSRKDLSQFIITIRDVLPPSPDDLRNHYYF